MKKYIYKVAIVISLLTLASCNKDLEEINIDPNKPKNVPTTGLFTSANKDIMQFTRGAFSSGRMALPWIQYSAQRNYTAEDRYQFRVGVNNSLYSQIFLTVKNYKTILDIVDNPAQAAKVKTYGDPDNQRAAARIMIAYAQLQLVDTYGDIPYYSYGSKDPDFQGMQVDEKNQNTLPVFAPQVKIYSDLMKELKEAAASINLNASNIFSEGDQIFGSPIKMKRFANSLRLRIATRVKSVASLTTEAEAHIQDAIAGGVMLSNDDSVTLQFQNDMIKPAPMFASAFIDKRNDFAPAKPFVSLLKGESGAFGTDPRLYEMVAPMKNLAKDESGNLVETSVRLYLDSSDPSLPNVQKNNYVKRDTLQYKGMPIGLPDKLTGLQRGVSSQFSFEVYRADYKLAFMEYSEVEFLLSEANSWDDTHYKKGIEASMQRWNVPSGDITAYLATVPGANKENVITQKYISLFMIPYEAWSEYRRTGFPNFDVLLKPGTEGKLNVPTPEGQKNYTFVSLVLDVANDLPERIVYPTDLDLVNKTNKNAAAQRMGGDKMNTKLIWARP